MVLFGVVAVSAARGQRETPAKVYSTQGSASSPGVARWFVLVCARWLRLLGWVSGGGSSPLTPFRPHLGTIHSFSAAPRAFRRPGGSSIHAPPATPPVLPRRPPGDRVRHRRCTADEPVHPACHHAAVDVRGARCRGVQRSSVRPHPGPDRARPADSCTTGPGFADCRATRHPASRRSPSRPSRRPGHDRAPHTDDGTADPRVVRSRSTRGPSQGTRPRRERRPSERRVGHRRPVSAAALGLAAGTPARRRPPLRAARLAVGLWSPRRGPAGCRRPAGPRGRCGHRDLRRPGRRPGRRRDQPRQGAHHLRAGRRPRTHRRPPRRRRASRRATAGHDPLLTAGLPPLGSSPRRHLYRPSPATRRRPPPPPATRRPTARHHPPRRPARITGADRRATDAGDGGHRPRHHSNRHRGHHRHRPPIARAAGARGQARG